MSDNLQPWKNWQVGNVVEDAGGSMQIVLFVDNDGSFECMNDKGEINNYSCGCHTYKAKNVLEYYTKGSDFVIGQLKEECETVLRLRQEIKDKDIIIEHLKNEVIDLRMED